jgi:undecaprenyl-diphosphatase
VIGLDHRAEHWFVLHRVGAIDDLFVWLSRVGTFGAVWLVLAAAFALALRRPQLLLLVVAADLLAYLLASGLKEVVDRPRPRGVDRLMGASGSSFPSGHAATSFACALVLAILLPRFAVPFFVLAAAIGFSRVYVGVHYPLDVVGGAALGLAAATALLLLARVPRGSRRVLRPG